MTKEKTSIPLGKVEQIYVSDEALSNLVIQIAIEVEAVSQYYLSPRMSDEAMEIKKQRHQDHGTIRLNQDHVPQSMALLAHLFMVEKLLSEMKAKGVNIAARNQELDIVVQMQNLLMNEKIGRDLVNATTRRLFGPMSTPPSGTEAIMNAANEITGGWMVSNTKH